MQNKFHYLQAKEQHAIKYIKNAPISHSDIIKWEDLRQMLGN